MKKILCCLIFLSFTAQLSAQDPAATSVEADQAPISPEAMVFFETKIRPVLVEHCFKCHGEGKHKGNLQLDNRTLMLSGGDSGPVIVPGNPAESLLIQAVNYDGYEMPPGQKLPADKIADLTKWIEMGAPWPGSAGEEVAAVRKGGVITDEDRSWWAFQPIKSPPVPQLPGENPVDNPIDAFVIETLSKNNLEPNPSAEARVLIRRAFFDLIGLPPTPEEMQHWKSALTPAGSSGIDQAAWSKLIDELLSRPQYGERWGRHWLDVVRFAQTNGYEFDREKTYAWRYRDYVINALNSDKPYDRFVLEQLAGDELPESTAESIIATGFYRLGLWDFEPDDALQSEFDDLDDIMVTSSAAFMGLTMGCARCHDHKFDPISHQDYHALLAFFRNVRKYNYPDESPENPGLLPISSKEQVQAALAERDRRWAELDAQIAAAEDDKQKEKLKKQRDDKSVKGLEWAMAVREYGLEPKPTHVLIRGNAQTPGEEVAPAILKILGGATLDIIPPAREQPFQTTGRRLALAKWLISDENPLTARVMVNRVWHYHFGRGIVPTTSDFGKVGALPSHPELLDWLASDFKSQGWSLKQLHRRIMLSQTYQRSSDSGNELADQIDPANALLWRHNLRRLDAESIRDSLLAVSGNLNPEMGGRGFFPLVGEEVLSGGTVPGVGWESSDAVQRNRRSMYTFIKRSLVSPQLDIFDYANTALPLTERPTTTVAPQALTLLNDQFMQKQAAAFARRVEAASDHNPDTRIQKAFELALTREPTSSELNITRKYLEQQQVEFAELRSRLMFRPIVPVSLHPGYLNPLSVHEFVDGPETDWTPLRGKWSKTGTLDTRQGPAGLWDGALFQDARLDVQITLGNASRLAGLLLRATESDNFVKGYEVLLNAQDSQLSIVRHAGEPLTIAEIPAVIPTQVPLPLRCEIRGGHIAVRLDLPDGPATIEVTDPNPLPGSGRLGARTWGAAFTLDGLTIDVDGRQIDVATAQLGPELPAAEPATWAHFGGEWSINPAGTLAPAKPDAGGKLIWNKVDFADGEVQADVRIHTTGRGDGGILLRVNQPQTGTDALHAYNINFSHDRIRLGKHVNNWRELASAPYTFSAETWTHLRAVIEGARIRIYLENQPEPLIDYTDSEPLPPGKIGFRTYHAPVEFQQVQLQTSNFHGPVNLGTINEQFRSKLSVVGMKPDSSGQKALESLCLLILNLNEMIYVE